jgi:hypothetical protein
MFRSAAAQAIGTWLFTTVGGILFFAFLLRRRRDDDQPFVAATAVAAANGPLDTPPDEANMPRWRRPSVQAGRVGPARYGPPISRPPLRFQGGPDDGIERAEIQYRFVRVADAPDDVRSVELGRLDRGDEVDVIERRTGFALVRAPDGLEGWVPRMTLAQAPTSS